MSKAGPMGSRKKSKQKRGSPYSTQDSSHSDKASVAPARKSLKSSSNKEKESSSTKRISVDSPPLQSASASKCLKADDMNLSSISDNEVSDTASMYSVEVTNKYTTLSNISMDEDNSRDKSSAVVNSKAQKPPPIVITEGIKNSQKFFKNLRSSTKENFEIKCVSNPDFCKTYIKASNADDFKTIVSVLKSSDVQFFTYGLRNEIPNKVILKGLHPTITSDEIKYELNELGFFPLDVIQFNRKGTSIKIPIFLVIFDPQMDIKNILEIKVICFTKVRWEKYRGFSRTIQCYRCQSFNHISVNCNVNPKCRRCAGSHKIQDCNVDSPKCANCDLAHEASDPNCQSRLRTLDRKNKNSSRRKQMPAPEIGSRALFPDLTSPDPAPAGTSNSFGSRPTNYATVASRKLTSNISSSNEGLNNSLKDLISLLNNPTIKDLLDKVIRLLKLLSQAKDGNEKVAILLGEGLAIFS